MKKIVVFASGSGSNFQSIIDAVKQGRIDAEIAGLVVSKESVGAVERARKADIPWTVLHPSEYPDEKTFGRALLEILEPWNPTLVVLAGYLHKIPDSVIRSFPARILNIHPSLLPRHGGKGLYGLSVHQSVLDAGDSESGCTVHLVNEVYDDGPILAQKKVPVKPDDTPESLARRVLQQEHQLYPRVIQTLLTQKENRS